MGCDSHSLNPAAFLGRRASGRRIALSETESFRSLSINRSIIRYRDLPGGQRDMTDRRTARRYDLSLPVLIRVPVERDACDGKTRDISTRGVYFIIENNLAAGAELDLTMTLPAEVTGGTEVFIRAIGKVVRVEKTAANDGRHGVAALIQRYEIVRNESMKS
jgi:hypothetical protein